MRNIRCFPWSALHFDIQIPPNGNINVLIRGNNINIPMLHPTHDKPLVYFEGNVPHEGFGANVDIIYHSTIDIPLPDIRKTVEEFREAKTAQLDIYMCAFPQDARAIFWNYHYPTFRRRWITLYFRGKVAHLFLSNNP